MTPEELLEKHPAPWRWDGAVIFDDNGELVMYSQGGPICEIINQHAALAARVKELEGHLENTLPFAVQNTHRGLECVGCGCPAYNPGVDKHQDFCKVGKARAALKSHPETL